MADRILTVPNAVTLVRLLCVPVFVWLLSLPHHDGWLSAGVLLGVLGGTDWVDGQLARRLGQVSTVGKVLDPVADRVLLLVGALSIVVVGAVPVWVAVAALIREGLVALGALAVAAAGGRRIDVTLIGKAGTFALMFAFPLFLIGHSHLGWRQAPEDAAWIFAVPGLIAAWAAAAGYVPLARAALVAGRRRPAEDGAA